jgi:hypothetical protein
VKDDILEVSKLTLSGLSCQKDCLIGSPYLGIPKTFHKCFYYHKGDTSCVKRKWQDHVSHFKAEKTCSFAETNCDASLDDSIKDTLNCLTWLTLDSTTVSAIGEP